MFESKSGDVIIWYKIGMQQTHQLKGVSSCSSMFQLQAQEDFGFLGNCEKQKQHADSRAEASQDTVREYTILYYSTIYRLNYYSCKTQTNTRVLPVMDERFNPASRVHITAPWFRCGTQKNGWLVGQDIDCYRWQPTPPKKYRNNITNSTTRATATSTHTKSLKNNRSRFPIRLPCKTAATGCHPLPNAAAPRAQMWAHSIYPTGPTRYSSRRSSAVSCVTHQLIWKKHCVAQLHSQHGLHIEAVVSESMGLTMNSWSSKGSGHAKEKTVQGSERWFLVSTTDQDIWRI